MFVIHMLVAVSLLLPGFAWTNKTGHHQGAGVGVGKSYRSSGSSKSSANSKDSPVRTCSFIEGLHANLLRFMTKDGFHRDIADNVEITITSSSIPITHFVNGECILVIYSEFTED